MTREFSTVFFSAVVSPFFRRRSMPERKKIEPDIENTTRPQPKPERVSVRHYEPQIIPQEQLQEQPSIPSPMPMPSPSKKKEEEEEILKKQDHDEEPPQLENPPVQEPPEEEEPIREIKEIPPMLWPDYNKDDKDQGIGGPSL